MPGRKRGPAADVLGLVIAVVVLAANTHDKAAGIVLLDQVAEHSGGSVRKALVDQGFRSQVVAHGAGLGIDVEIVERDPQVKRFVPQPKRWRVEQTYGILIPHRRLARDYEHCPSSAMERRYEYSFDRPNWFEQSAAEHRAVREGVGVIDTSSFGKLLVQGHDAVRVLQRVSVNDLYTEPGRITYTQWLNEHGGIESDVTITRLTEDRFLVLSGGAESETECMCVCPSLPTYRPAPADPRTAPFGKSASRPTSSNGSLGR